MTNVQPITPTPSRVRSYESIRADGLPKQFAIDGETFSCLPACPGGVYTEVAYRLELAADDSGKQGMAGLGLIKRFFDSVLLEDDAGEEYELDSRSRFVRKLASKSEIVDIALLGEIMTGLMEDYAGRPFTPASPSPG